MGYVVTDDVSVYVRPVGGPSIRLEGGDEVPDGIPEAQIERLDRAGLIGPAPAPGDGDGSVSGTTTAAEPKKPRKPRAPRSSGTTTSTEG